MRDETLLAELHQLPTLKSVLTWSLAREPRAEFVDVVIQDEFHHDVVVRVSDRVYAVFETSWLGAVMAVATWDHLPSPGELLERRIERGWRPTPTATIDGEVVLGYAACTSGRLDERGAGMNWGQCELPG
jgi:hypothetical protein